MLHARSMCLIAPPPEGARKQYRMKRCGIGQPWDKERGAGGAGKTCMSKACVSKACTCKDGRVVYNTPFDIHKQELQNFRWGQAVSSVFERGLKEHETQAGHTKRRHTRLFKAARDKICADRERRIHDICRKMASAMSIGSMDEKRIKYSVNETLQLVQAQGKHNGVLKRQQAEQIAQIEERLRVAKLGNALSESEELVVEKCAGMEVEVAQLERTAGVEKGKVAEVEAAAAAEKSKVEALDLRVKEAAAEISNMSLEEILEGATPHMLMAARGMVASARLALDLYAGFAVELHCKVHRWCVVGSV